ncbi:hypothetical protein ACP70R_047328 [Stipagrostis hirtigluma subsp. patula]
MAAPPTLPVGHTLPDGAKSEEPGEQHGGAAPAGVHGDPAWQLRKYLLLLAILVATVTYVAGLDPPGGVWLETKDGHRTGNPILPDTRRLRYTLFYYFNALAFAASLVVILLLLFHESVVALRAVQVVVVVDFLCLATAYVAGSCRGRLTTVYASALCSVVLFLALLAICLVHFTDHKNKSVEDGKSDDARKKGEAEKAAAMAAADKNQMDNGMLGVKERRKVLMLLAIFVTTITYTAALNPPGGFWEHAQEGHHAGDPVLLERHSPRFLVFLFGNTAAFAASLVIVTLLLSSRLWRHHTKLTVLCWGVAVALLGLMVAYTAGSSRKTHTTVYVVCLVILVAAYIVVIAAIEFLRKTWTDNPKPSWSCFWRDDGDGHNGGDLILLATHARRYKVFFYCNSAAFVASIVVVIMVQSTTLVSHHALRAAVILDLFGLMGAYAAGSCRDVLISVYVFALAAAIFVGVVMESVVKRFLSATSSDGGNGDVRGNKGKEKNRKLLLLLAILVVTITYQAGLTPPGKFWLEHGDAVHHVGDPVLADNYPRRYKAFFYCNATSFMTSVVVIVMLLSRDLAKAGKASFWLLYTCMGASLVGLLGAFAAGTPRKVTTSAYVFVLAGVVLLVALMQIDSLKKLCLSWSWLAWLSSNPSIGKEKRSKNPDHATYHETYRMKKYLLLLGILAASVTYQAGLDPPGGVWPEHGDGHEAGDPVLRAGDLRRYRAFFYSNSACFVASVVVIVLLLQSSLLELNGTWLIRATHAAVVLDLLGLLVAYTTGSSRDWGTATYVLAMAAAVLAYVGIYVLLSSEKDGSRRPQNRAEEQSNI